MYLLKCCIDTLTDFNQSLLDFINVVDLRLEFMLICDTLDTISHCGLVEAIAGVVQE